MVGGGGARAVRIGIDVGGTFTKAVALDDASLELLGQAQVPTTHTAPEGVALGIVEALEALLRERNIAPEQVRFIAHGTTQATNALLEGDVVSVGIVATGAGLEGARARTETQIGDLELAPEKWLRVVHAFVEADRPEEGVRAVKARGAGVIVAAEPFSVDDPAGELKIMEAARTEGLPATGTHAITKLYGLRVRTRTAAVNASILPRMVDTADRTEASVLATGITAPLMIMRSDGGVMTVSEVRERPILTMLSGPAAGVAGALMYEKVSNGIFCEVGGTSTDISAIKNGRVVVDYAEVGGHKTYTSSLDVRTVGVAGGSLIRLRGKTVAYVGPRSAHITGLAYSVFAEPEAIQSPVLETFSPQEGDPADYVRIRCADGSRYALTVACAANLLGYVRPGHYALGNAEAARRAFAPLAESLGTSVEDAARDVLRVAVAKVTSAVNALLERYGLDKQSTVLVGGGGGAGALAPVVAEALGMECRVARNHDVISPIGVALALVRDVIERTVPNPTEQDILRIRTEAEEAALRAGAAPGTVEVRVEVDAARNLVRATATGATELRTRDLAQRQSREEGELRAVAAVSMGLPDAATAALLAHVGRWCVYSGAAAEKALFGLVRRTRRACRVLDDEGVIRLSRGEEPLVETTTVGALGSALTQILSRTTAYGDAGALVPETFLLCGERMADLSGLPTAEQITAIAATNTQGFGPDEPVAVVCFKRR